MIKLFDRVKVNIPTTGTGDIEFGAAASTAFLTPTEAGVLDGDEVRYVIVDGLDFEEGVGLIKDTVATMERTVTKSKVGGVVGTSALNLSGTAVLALTASAADILTPDDNLASLVDADAALDNLGGTTTGKSLFTSADEDTALDNLGGGATGIGLFKAANEAAALSEIPSAYHLDNIIGSVGYSGGKNTGAIMESGSNANGSYVKYADGRLECTIMYSSSDAINTAWGSLYIGGAWTRRNWPATFVASPAEQISVNHGTSGTNSAVVGGTAGSTTTQGPSFYLARGTSSSSQTYYICVEGKGRWRA